jgi:hypothetical protein
MSAVPDIIYDMNAGRTVLDRYGRLLKWLECGDGECMRSFVGAMGPFRYAVARIMEVSRKERGYSDGRRLGIAQDTWAFGFCWQNISEVSLSYYVSLYFAEISVSKIKLSP